MIQQTYPDLLVLHYYSIENYFYHPDNLAEYYDAQNVAFDRDKYVRAWLDVKNQERDKIILRLMSARQSYPFFRESTKEAKKKLDIFKSNAETFIDLLKSDDFKTFYPSLPAKDVGKTIPERLNLDKQTLGQTRWFGQQIARVVGQ